MSTSRYIIQHGIKGYATRDGMGFDVIGDIAIIELAEGESGKAAAESLRKRHPQLRTILKKTGAREGEFRTRGLEKLWGDGNETTHIEHGMRFHLDVSTCYFSPRELTERQRIASEVAPMENVMVLFAGVGPFSIAIAKKQPKVGKVFSMELNPDCVRYMEENVKLNACRYVVEPILGDVAKDCKPYFRRCDRVIMPLPREGYKFLPIAIKCLKPKGGVIHFYYVGGGEDLFGGAIEIAKTECKKLGKKCKILGQHRVLPFGPGMFKVCIDFEVR